MVARELWVKRDSPPKVAGTDYTFTCPNRYAVRGFIDTTAAPTWTYVFNHSISFTSWGQNFTFCDGHSCNNVPVLFPEPTYHQYNPRLDPLFLHI